MTSLDPVRRDRYCSMRDDIEPGSLAPEPRAFAGPPAAGSGDLSGWLDIDPVPVLLVGAGGELLQANRSGQHLVAARTAVSLRGGALVFTDNQAQQSFSRALVSVISRRAISSRLILRGNDGCWRQVEINSCGPDACERAFVRLATEPQGSIEIEPLLHAFALSPSEGEVLRRLMEGFAPKEIARVLCISTNTVRAHLRMLYLKMNVRGIPGVIRQAVRLTR